MHNYNEIRQTNPKFVIVGIITALMLLGTTAISTLTTPESVFAYRSSQATSHVNDCGHGELPLNVGCQNTDSQIQGDENAVALTAQQTFPSQEPPTPPTTATLIVITNVECATGQQCPGLPTPSTFTMTVVQGPTVIASFPGSPTGTPVTLEPGEYFVSGSIQTLPPGLGLTTTRSPECTSLQSGPIEAGEERTCIFTNTFRPLT
jgi:hypothetical protein